MPFASLAAYAQFILDNYLDEFVHIHIQRTKEVELPLLQLFAHLTDEQVFLYNRESVHSLLLSMVNGTAMQAASERIKLWKSGQLLNVPKDKIDTKDMAFTPHTRKYAFVQLLKKYTTDISVYESIVQELDFFYAYYQQMSLGAFVDIHHELLIKEKTFVETLLDHTTDGISAYDQDRRITVWNKALEQRTGVQKSQIIGQNLFDLFPSYKDSQEGKAVEHVLAGQTITLQDMPLRDRAGYYEADLTPIFNSRHEVIGGVSFSRDITGRKQAAEQLKKSEAIMAQAQSIAHVGSWEWNDSAKVFTWSDELYRIFGYEPRSVNITYDWILSHIHPDNVAEVQGLITKSAGQQGGFELTSKIIRKDKSIRIIYTKGLVSFDEVGNTVRMVGASQDVTEETETKELLQGVLNGSLAGLMYLKSVRNAEGVIVDYKYILANEAACRILRIDANLAGTTLLSKYPLFMTSYIFPEFGRVVQSGSPYFKEVLYEMDGFSNWFKVYAVKLNDGLVVSFEDVTATKEAESKLQQEKEFSDSLITYNIDGIVSLDTSLNYTAWNPVMEKLVGKRKEDVVGKQVLEVFPDSRDSEGVQAMRAALQGKTTKLLGRKFSTGAAYYDSYVFPLFNKEVQITGVMSIVHDVTEQKLAEEKILENQKFIKGIADATPNMLYVYDLQAQKNVYSNNVLLRILGYPHSQNGQLDQSMISRLLHPEDATKISDRIRQYQALQDGEILSWDYRMLDANGRYKWFSARELVHKRTESGEPWQILGLAEDVTEIKQATLTQQETQAELEQKNNQLANALEELQHSKEYLVQLNNQLEDKVQERTQKLIKSENELRLITDALPVLVAYVDAEERYQFNNKAYQEWFGRPLEDFKGKRMPDLIEPEVYRQAEPYIHRVLAGEKVTYDILMFRGTDRQRFATVTYIPHLDNGRIPGFYAIVIDINERVKHEQALQQAFEEMEHKNQELNKINELLDNFVYMAAHDLKSPVANLKLLAGMLIRTDNTVHPELFKAIIESVNRLDATINGLVEVIEVQSVQDIPVKELDLQKQVELITKDFSEEIQHSNTLVQADFSAVSSIRYVEAYLQSIVKNLISNAIKYRSTARNLHLQINSRQEDGFTVLAFADNGMGMNLNKYKQHIFKPFTRFTNRASGKGLGLHLIKAMVEKNGGKVLVESEPEKGTTFYVYLKEY